jgi:hypothetical protein
LNLTATNTTAAGFLTAWPSGTPRQTTSNLNFNAGQNVPNLVVVPVGANGMVSIYNFAGTTDVVADVVGWYTGPNVSVPGGSTFHALPPARLADTRLSGDTLSNGGIAAQDVRGHGGVPAAGVAAVVLNVTVTNTTAPGFLTVWPDGAPRPTASSLNFVASQTVPNAVITKVGGNGLVDFYNFGGDTDVVVDVVGWYGTA